MTSSGTYAFSPSNGEIVLAAYERIQIRTPSIRQEHMLSARREVNFLLSSWNNRTPNLWTVELISQALTQGTETYDVAASVVMILDAYISLDNGETTQTDRYITPISRTDYASYSAKFVQGQPTTYWFDRLRSPTVTLWPVPDGNGPYTLNYYVCRQLEDANLASGETPGLPNRFLDAQVADLAHRLSRIYPPAGVDPLAFQAARKQDAKDAWDEAAEQDTEGTPLTLAPSLSGYYR